MRISILLIVLLSCQYGYSAFPNWTVVPQSYQYQMTLSSRVSIRCSDTNNSTVLVGAFVNGICRGVDTNKVLINGYYNTFITIFSNQQVGEKVYFKLYDPMTDIVYDAVDSIDFENNKIESSMVYPYKLMSNYKPERIDISSTVIYNVLPVNTIIADFSTVDKNNTSFQYSIIPESNMNSDYFSVSGNSLLIQKLMISDTNKKLKVKIQTDDMFGCTLDSIFIFDVVNTDPPPTGLVPKDSVIFEHSTIGTLARKLLAQDASPVDTHVFELVTGEGSSGNANFRIEGDQLFVNSDMEYSNASALPIRIRITDRARNIVDVMTKILLKEFVYTIKPSPNTIREHSPMGTLAKQLDIEDVDNSGPYTISLIDGEGSKDNFRYSIKDNNQLIVNSVIEYDTASLHAVRVSVVNKFNNKIEYKLNVNILEFLYTVRPTENKINEHVAIGTVAKIIEVEDVNNSGPYTMSLVPGEGSQDNYRYSISNNQLIVNSDIEYDSAVKHNVRVAIVNNFGNKIEFKLNVDILETINSGQPLKANNLVTPNADGTNDVFEIQNVYLYTGFSLVIMDDNGSIVNQYSAVNPYVNNWDGTSQTGIKLPTGHYYYYMNNANNEHVFKGTIYLMQP
jgi:gliding motility-associated-like protein